MPKKTVKRNIASGSGTPDDIDGLKAASSRVVIPDEFKGLIPSMDTDFRESALWRIRVRGAADLDALRRRLLESLLPEGQKALTLDRDTASCIMAYCRVDERISRILGFEKAEDDVQRMPSGPLLQITVHQRAAGDNAGDLVLNAAKEIIGGNGNGNGNGHAKV